MINFTKFLGIILGWLVCFPGLARTGGDPVTANMPPPTGQAAYVAPPVNDSCQFATLLTPGTTCVPTAGTTIDAGPSLPAITCAGATGTADDDVWYRFTATSTSHTVTVDGNPGFDAVVDVRTSCSGATTIACADTPINGGTEIVVLAGLAIGTTYIVRVYSYGPGIATKGTFTICVTTPNAPACLSAPVAPANGQSGICPGTAVTLSWPAGAAATSYDVYFGTNPMPPFVANVSTTTYVTGALPAGTYYWQIRPANPSGTAQGCPIWTFVVNDAAPPMIICPPNFTVQCIEDVPACNPTDATATDNCDADVSISCAQSLIGSPCNGTVIKIYTAADNVNNLAVCGQEIKVQDTIDPVVTITGMVASCYPTVAAAAAAALAATSAMDNCGGTVTETVATVGTCPATVTVTETDACGNAATAVYMTCIDDIPPRITCPPNFTVQCIEDVPACNPTDATATDNCDADVIISCAQSLIGSPCNGTVIKIYIAADNFDNLAVCGQEIKVQDTIDPVVTITGMVASCFTSIPDAQAAVLAALTVTDNCSTNLTPVFTASLVTDGTCNAVITATVTDACGNVGSAMVTVRIDGLPPVVVTGQIAACYPTVTAAQAAALLATTATDNCPGPLTEVAVTVASTVVACLFTITVTVTDGCGNAATAVYTTRIDNTPPVLTCPGPLTVSCASNVPAPNTASVTGVSDNCGGAVTVTFVGDVTTPGTCANRFTVTRTYRATDACGNSATCTQVITVNDVTAPALTCPGPVTVSCASNVPAPNTASVTGVSDNCGGAVTVTFVGDVTTPGTCANRFTVTRTYRATDACGNSATCTQVITVNDVTAPALTCPGPVTVSCASQVPAPNVTSVTGTSDNCGGAVTVTFVGDVTTPGTCANRFTVTRTYRATDACGNSATCTQVITVFDNTAPVITCPAPVTVQCASQVPAATPGTIVTSDNCGGTVTVTLVGDVITNMTCVNRFTLTRTYRATDVCGNSATCTQVITVFDNTPPVLANVPPNVTVDCLLIPGVTLPTATDNCAGNVTVILVSEVQTPGICPVLYTLTRTFRATDACGNSATVSQVITVVDVTPPQFTNDPIDVILECNLAINLDSLQSYLDNFGGATVFDCSDVTLTFMDTPGHFCPSTCAGTFQRYIRFIATDECGNVSFRDARFIVVDLTPPSFDVLPQNLAVECMPGCNGEAEMYDWLDNFGYAEVSDLCGTVETAILFLGEKPGCGNTFIRTYQFRATDICGNTNYVTATFSVVDTTPPVIEKCPEGNVSLDCIFDVPGPDLAGLIATDNCGDVTVTATTYTIGAGCAYWPMTVNYWYMVTDECGNMTTCDQPFYIVDLTPANYTGPDTIDVVCVDDLPQLEDLTDILSPYMDDNCQDIICIGNIVAQNGTNSVTFEVGAKDFCGNISAKFLVTFVATGNCKPLCTATQATLNDPQAQLSGLTTTQVIGQLIGEFGGLEAGNFGKTVTVTSAACLQSMLPANGNTNQLAAGNLEFSDLNGCLDASPLLNGDGTLINELVATVLTVELNMLYNQKFNNRNLGMRRLSELPDCAVDAAVLAKLTSGPATVQSLLNLANNYLAGAGAFPANFGDLLNEALENVNQYYQNCQITDPCNSQNRFGAQHSDNPFHFSLAPNPVLDVVTLRFDMDADAEVQLRFIGSNGVQTAELVQAVKGSNAFNVSTKNFPAGVYTVVLQQNDKLQTLRMVKVKY